MATQRHAWGRAANLSRRSRQALAALAVVSGNPQLRRVAIARVASVTGRWASTIALAVFAYNAGGATYVGVLGVVRILPAALAGPLAAGLLDRVRRRPSPPRRRDRTHARDRRRRRRAHRRRGRGPRLRPRLGRVAPLDDGASTPDLGAAVPRPHARRADGGEPLADDRREHRHAARPRARRAAPDDVGSGRRPARHGRRLSRLDPPDRADPGLAVRRARRAAGPAPAPRSAACGRSGPTPACASSSASTAPRTSSPAPSTFSSSSRR